MCEWLCLRVPERPRVCGVRRVVARRGCDFSLFYLLWVGCFVAS